MLLSLVLLACTSTEPTKEPAPQVEPGDPPVFKDIGYDPQTDVTDLAEQAIGISPAWVQDDLRLAFQRMDRDDQDEFAAVLVDLDEPWLIDEVAFSLAHSSLEMVQAGRFDPQLLVHNARWIYEVEPDLQYVELVEEGEAGSDADWTTTTRYRYESGGEVVEVTVDPMVYYWYVVHPRIEDEGSYWIDAWDACSSGDLECPTTQAMGGAFWREFLWSGAEESCPEGDHCPVLRDAMGDVEVLWKDTGGGEGAIGAIRAFMVASDEELGRWFTFGASGERSIQPNRIYALGRGNCGEWADMTSALARTALIPNYNTTPSSWDHTWNEFYDPHDDRWVAWEPVNGWFDHAYGSRYANYATRGDTRVFHVTDDYTDDTFTMEVAVTDADGRPVDGATVALWSPFEQDGQTYWWYAGEGFTGLDGRASFPLVADKQFGMRVESEAGNLPEEDNSLTYASDGIAAGETDVLEVALPGSTATIGARSPADWDDAAVAELQVGGGIRTARVITDSFRFGETYTAAVDGAAPIWFITDEDGFDAYKDGEDFEVLAEGVLGDGGAVSLDPEQRRVFVVVNDTARTAVFGSADLEMVPGADATWEGEVAFSLDLHMMPGEYHAVKLRPE
jgi:hypothetical protein